VVRRIGAKLGGAGVDGLVHRPDAKPLAQQAHPVLPSELRPQRSQLPVGKAGPLGLAQQRRVQHGRALDLGAKIDQARDLIHEPRVDSRRSNDFANRRSEP
jgi:hypothetical protein